MKTETINAILSFNKETEKFEVKINNEVLISTKNKNNAIKNFPDNKKVKLANATHLLDTEGKQLFPRLPRKTKEVETREARENEQKEINKQILESLDKLDTVVVFGKKLSRYVDQFGVVRYK